MDLETIRQLVSDLGFSVAGIPATLQGPWESPLEGRIVWLRNLEEDAPYGTQYAKVGARRRMAIQRDGVTNIPKGSIVTAPEEIGAEATDWQVDGTEEVTRTHFLVAVTPATGLVSGT